MGPNLKNKFSKVHRKPIFQQEFYKAPLNGNIINDNKIISHDDNKTDSIMITKKHEYIITA